VFITTFGDNPVLHVLVAES